MGPKFETLPVEILDNIYKLLTAEMCIRYQPSTTVGGLPGRSRPHPMLLVNKQQSEIFSGIMIRNSTVIFVSRYGMLHFIHACPNKHFLRRVELQVEFGGRLLDDHVAYLVSHLFRDTPNVSHVRFTVSELDGIRMPKAHILNPDGKYWECELLDGIRQGTSLFQKISTFLLEEYSEDTRSESGEWFWAVATKLGFFDSAEEPHVELQCQLRIIHGFAKIEADALLDFKSSVLRLKLHFGGGEFSIQQDPWQCPEPTSQDCLQAASGRIKALEANVVEVVHKMSGTGQPLSLTGRHALLNYLTRSHTKSDGCLLC